MIQKKIFFLVTLCLLLFSCDNELTPLGDNSISLFKNTNLYFDMEFKSNPSKLNDSILRLDAGRVIVKKIKLPSYDIQPKVMVNIDLTSNGDPWDKSGSLFVIPKSSGVSLLDFEDGSFDLTKLSTKYPATHLTEYDTVYHPNVELMRFMTPFGVGYFNENEHTKNRKPVYIPEWESKASWSQDITHLLPLLEEEVYIGVYIDTWTKEGYNISVSLDFEESKIPHHEKQALCVLPLVNTVKYGSQQRHYDQFSTNSLKVEFDIDHHCKNAQLFYVTTGHGGHAEGDEFTKEENIISLDGKVIKQFTPWRNDCASFRRFNPSSGVWMEHLMWEDEETEERISSSDLSRSNWCPGSTVEPEIVDLGDLIVGNHILEIAIPDAQPAIDDEHNYWMVSAYLSYELE